MRIRWLARHGLPQSVLRGFPMKIRACPGCRAPMEEGYGRSVATMALLVPMTRCTACSYIEIHWWAWLTGRHAKGYRRG
jgi:hypothetical protein